MSRRCNCPNGSYGVKHTDACYEKQIKDLEQQRDTGAVLLREWLCASSEFNLEAWARRVRDFVEDELPACDHGSRKTLNADGWCLVCGEFA